MKPDEPTPLAEALAKWERLQTRITFRGYALSDLRRLFDHICCSRLPDGTIRVECTSEDEATELVAVMDAAFTVFTGVDNGVEWKCAIEAGTRTLFVRCSRVPNRNEAT